MGQLVAIVLILYAVSGIIRRQFEFHVGRTEKPLLLTGQKAILTAAIILIGSTVMLISQSNGVLFIAGFILAISGFVLGVFLNRFVP
jgi:hypothetical protein